MMIAHSVFKLHVLFSNLTFCFQTQTLIVILELAEVLKYTKTVVPFYSISISLIKNIILTNMTCTYKYNTRVLEWIIKKLSVKGRRKIFVLSKCFFFLTHLFCKQFAISKYMYILNISRLFVNFQNRFISIFYMHDGFSSQEKTCERILRGKRKRWSSAFYNPCTLLTTQIWRRHYI